METTGVVELITDRLPQLGEKWIRNAVLGDITVTQDIPIEDDEPTILRGEATIIWICRNSGLLRAEVTTTYSNHHVTYYENELYAIASFLEDYHYPPL